MPADALRESVRDLMGRAKDDLAELVAFKSVADPKQFPPEECANAAQWVIDAFAEVGLQDVKMSPTPDGSMARPRPRARRRRARRPCCCTATTTCSRRWARTHWDDAGVRADRA